MLLDILIQANEKKVERKLREINMAFRARCILRSCIQLYVV